MHESARAILTSIQEACNPRARTASFCRELLKRPHPTHLLAIGKAAVPMAQAALGELRIPPTHAFVLTTPHQSPSNDAESFELLVADHPLPSERNLHAAERVTSFVQDLPANAHLLVLLSGGGSALLTSPSPPLTLDDIRNVSAQLMRAGAPVQELNCVRKHIETLKGGRLAQLISAGHISVGVISDVIGDDLSVIASGPFAPDPTSYADAFAVLERYDLAEACPRIAQHLEDALGNGASDTPSEKNACFERIKHMILMNNETAARAAKSALERTHAAVEAIFNRTSEANDLGREAAVLLQNHNAVVLAGEPVVSNITPDSQGGPMQEAALSAAIALESTDFDWLVIGYATDGIDGPTDAAGAIITRSDINRAQKNGLSLDSALTDHDTFGVLNTMNALIRTGPTGANVNDVLVALRL